MSDVDHDYIIVAASHVSGYLRFRSSTSFQPHLVLIRKRKKKTRDEMSAGLMLYDDAKYNENPICLLVFVNGFMFL